MSLLLFGLLLLFDVLEEIVIVIGIVVVVRSHRLIMHRTHHLSQIPVIRCLITNNLLFPAIAQLCLLFFALSQKITQLGPGLASGPFETAFHVGSARHDIGRIGDGVAISVENLVPSDGFCDAFCADHLGLDCVALLRGECGIVGLGVGRNEGVLLLSEGVGAGGVLEGVGRFARIGRLIRVCFWVIEPLSEDIDHPSSLIVSTIFLWLFQLIHRFLLTI